MFLTFVPGIFTDWNHPREIAHLTSKDGVKWDSLGPIDVGSDKIIDACVVQLPDGKWRMWYKDERKEKSLSYADSTDLIKWEPKGNAVTDFNGEGPKVIHWQGKYWLIADCWANGMRVWSSDDATHWKLQEEPLFGSHGDVVISGNRAWWFYFGGPRMAPNAATAVSAGTATPVAPASPAPAPNVTAAPAATLASGNVTAATTTTAAPPAARGPGGRGRGSAINVVELTVADGKLVAGNPAQPTYIDLKSMREEEK
jgi:hypothetical protein